MTLLILGLAIFLGVHSTRIFAEEFRNAQVAKLGLTGWKAVYSIASLAGFVLIVVGYGEARMAPVAVWSPPLWTQHVAALLTIPAFILLAAAYVPGTRIRRAVGHPMVVGVKIWAFAHLIANGTLADVLLFGSFLAWAILDYASARRRDRAAGTEYVTGPMTRDLTALMLGLAAWAAFAFWLHVWLIGVRPFGG
ncbi:NnrU family protein [Accumulibacter sp.]|uniref:NnrU family protein n=1 Tax=Accumulibacter sp. TaxID=2053492 RepID=UPI001A4E2BD3|nr:NnrU family protein [Accumulibacter sp.]MBL8374241.1 NnrU family protein [Accumulibacter sp.]